jgi:hypothetical protein
MLLTADSSKPSWLDGPCGEGKPGAMERQDERAASESQMAPEGNAESCEAASKFSTAAVDKFVGRHEIELAKPQGIRGFAGLPIFWA